MTLKDSVLGSIYVWNVEIINTFFICRKKHQASGQMYGPSPPAHTPIVLCLHTPCRARACQQTPGPQDPWRSQVAEGMDTCLERVTKPQGGGWDPEKYTPFLIAQNRCHLSRVVPTLPSQEFQKVSVCISSLLSSRDISPAYLLMESWNCLEAQLPPTYSAESIRTVHPHTNTDSGASGRRLCTAGSSSHPPIHKHSRGRKKMGLERSFP